jgi:hypothetical protein
LPTCSPQPCFHWLLHRQLLVEPCSLTFSASSILSRTVACHSNSLSPCLCARGCLLPFTHQVFHCFPYSLHHWYFSKVILPLLVCQ